MSTASTSVSKTESQSSNLCRPAIRKYKMIYYCDNKRHLVCEPYSIENLHAMANDLNIKRCWYHSSKYPHYDIPKKRIDEISAKCVVLSQRELFKKLATWADSSG